jgi:DNA invertase Pin-like site-specific DNA recombinase
VTILIADMPTYNGNDRKDVLIRQIRGAIAEENRKEIIERLWKGRQERVRRGLPPGGNVPYGYRRSPNGLVPDEAESEAVRIIFALAHQEETKSSIARTLNSKGLERRNGQPWTPRQVTAILSRSDLYRDGCFRYGEASGTDDRLAIVRSES